MSTIEIIKLHTLTGHNDCIYTLQPGAQHHEFFSAAGDGMVVAWDLHTPEKGQLIAKLPNSVYALHYHHGSNALVAGQNYEGIHLLDPQNKKEVGSLQITKAAIFDIQSQGNSIFTASGDGIVQKIDVNTLTVTSKSPAASKSARTIAVNEARGEVVVGYSDNFIRVFDSDNLHLKHAWAGHDNSVFTVRFTPDGKYLITGSRDARLKQWDVEAGYKQSAEVVAHMFAINHLDYSPDSKHFVTCSLDKTVKVWDSEALKLLKVIDRARHQGHRTSVNKVLWTAHHNQLLSAGDDRTIAVWHIIF